MYKGVSDMLLSELGNKEVIDLNKGEKLGLLGNADLEIDEQSGQIIAILISTSQWLGFKKKGNEIRVPWSCIKKIGADMIMIETPNGISLDK